MKFCHNSHAFLWRKIESKSTFVEKKWQLWGLLVTAIKAMDSLFPYAPGKHHQKTCQRHLKKSESLNNQSSTNIQKQNGSVINLSAKWTLPLKLHFAIWQRGTGKSHRNATNATLHLFAPTLWRGIWKFTLEKNCTIATNATLHLFRQAIWGHIWKLTKV